MSSKKSNMEKKALKLIIETGEEGLTQTELWKLLDISSREASRIAKKHEDKGRVSRERVLHNGRWTFKLVSIKNYVTLDSIEGSPCLVCPDVDKCFRGGKKDPSTCLDLTAWIDPRIKPLPIKTL